MLRSLSLLGKALMWLVRAPLPRRPPARHWYPKYWHPETPHVCYYCGRYDQEEVEVTDPPCPGKRRILI